MEQFQGINVSELLGLAGLSDDVVETAATAFAEQRYGDVYGIWTGIDPEKQRAVLRKLPREVRMAAVSVDDLGLSPSGLDDLIKAARTGDVETVLSVYRSVPAKNRARIITRLPTKARVVAEAFDGLRQQEQLAISVDALPQTLYVQRVERMGVEAAAAGTERGRDEGPRDVSKRLRSIGATGAVRSQVATLGAWIRDGPFTLRVLSFLAGLYAIVAAGVGFFVNIGDVGTSDGRSLLFLVINVWIGIFGLLLVVSEARSTLCSAYLRRLVETGLPLLRSTSGRAWFMFFVGSLAMSQWTPSGSQVLNLASGIVLEILAIANTVVSCRAHAAMARVRAKLSGPEVEAKFDEFDIDGSGKLDTAEFAELCAALGSSLSRNELESALLTLDTNRDGVISRPEFLAWWRGDQGPGGLVSATQTLMLDADADSGAAALPVAAAGEAAAATGPSSRTSNSVRNPLADVDV